MNYKPQQANQRWYAILSHNNRRLNAIPCASYAEALALCETQNKIFHDQRWTKRDATRAVKTKLLMPEANPPVDVVPSVKGV